MSIEDKLATQSAKLVPNLTLYDIEVELLGLLQFREELASDPEITPEELRDSLEACDAQIREYVGREIKKVDGIASMLREFEAREALTKKEADRIYDQAAKWRKRREVLESITMWSLQSFGRTKIEGKTSTLSLKRCPASVDIAQPDILPDKYKRRSITINEDLLKRIITALPAELALALMGTNASVMEPLKTPIGDELKCPVCQAKSALREKCQACGGTGESKSGVPGARLVTDKVRLDVS